MTIELEDYVSLRKTKKENKQEGVNEVLRIIPLGGIGEIGKNMTAIEWGESMIVIDCGLCFPGEELLGVDYVCLLYTSSRWSDGADKRYL